MPEHTDLEFTGERVVPGLVDADLFNEHLARYRFAARFALDARVLDAGCGTGYGTAELGNATRVIGVDIAAEAVAHAVRAFGKPGVEFIQGACESLPFADEWFDLIAAFEVIEHLTRWADLLQESRRVLRPTGVLLVSTPNKAYYAEARGAAGPNPYHAREFEYVEFQSILRDVFPYVHLWTQNHSESISFVPATELPGVLDAPADRSPEQGHFFLAACSQSPISDTRPFAWLPGSGNVLRERERHVALLKSELFQKDEWLSQGQTQRDELQKVHEGLLDELRQSNTWAQSLNEKLETSGTEIRNLQAQLEHNNAWAEGLNGELKANAATIENLQAELRNSNAWASGLDEQVVAARARLIELEQELQVRFEWVQDLNAQLERLGGENRELNITAQQMKAQRDELQSERNRLEAQLRVIGDSRWVRLGRKVGVGPVIDQAVEK